MSQVFKLTALETSVVDCFINQDGEVLELVSGDIATKTGKAKRSVSGALGSLTKKGVLTPVEVKEGQKGVKAHTLSEAYLEAYWDEQDNAEDLETEAVDETEEVLAA